MIIGFIIGTIIGITLGVIIMCLLTVSSEKDKDETEKSDNAKID